MTAETISPTLEDVLEHISLFNYSELYELICKRYRSVLWIKETKPKRKEIYMLREINNLNGRVKIIGHKFNNEKLILNTNKGDLIFSK